MPRFHRSEFDFLPEQAFRPRPGGGMTLEGGGGGGGSSQAENYTALMQANMSAEQLAWGKQIYAEEAPERAATQARANAVSDAQLASMKASDAMGKDAYDDYKRTYLPVEQQIVEQARGYDTEAKREAAAGAAAADVSQGFSIATDSAARDLGRAGVNVNDGRAIATRAQLVSQEALARANASNQARRQVETVGAAKMADAANLGRNIASSQATTASLALNQGNSAVANSAAALAAGQSGQAALNQAYSGAQGGMAAAGRTFGSLAGREAQDKAAGQANTAAGVGAVVTIGVAI